MTLVFVYGSLKTGFGNNFILQDNDAELIGTATTMYSTFRMHSLGAFPAVVEDNRNGKEIVGEVWSVNSKRLRALDRLESNGRLYERRLVSLSLVPEATILQAWMYVFLGNPEHFASEDDSDRGIRVSETDRDFEWISE